jgi:hypothetical protein
MNNESKYTFTYDYKGGYETVPVKVTFEFPTDISLNDMLGHYELFLKAASFHFDGHLEIVPDEIESGGGCMADWDDEDDDPTFHDTLSTSCCGLKDTSSSLENKPSIDWDEYDKKESEQKLKEWNEGIAKLDEEVKEQREIRDKASTRADELKEMNERWSKISNEEKIKLLEKVLKKSGL